MADQKRKPSTVYFIGTGPGDPELITVKGMKLLKEADLVIYAGSLVRERVLEYCERSPEIFNSASMSLPEITSLMTEAARKGKKVVRLQTGDPSLYGALREQAEALEKEEIPYVVVPGVSSAFASAAALKRELTLPGVTQTVIFTRMEGRTPVPDKERLRALSSHGSTICVFLSISMIEDVVRELLAGYTPETPVAVVYRASWEDELVIKGTLADIAGKVNEAGVTRQAMIIVGNAIGDGPVERSRLYDPGFSHGFRK
ncbi:MAG TPA: precorrin-4 C(11)-methyltransferase [Deltaproteobacteria bacterium]|nr:MAG: precorrin-4 C(11)-methyltransferase [Deltaproteobacteria bacterium GWA2_55_82]OGQ64057.1 MAG: precorrin-4 C(11)-methyltransferase [Deltaproteobacteria bacterium RIFCSPLOWO2_02_FULL_55_12]OIJ74507.1 MAG: precorrin-4 C(11)-methyltransferase [Deltaproteobacteria bacterium GWC2_55_46]HBG47170.1 precorrin-4 C(11)-methyltransferase [Deltaproteobacteria bacterium]HCY10769.1 precorrin-4 C(11)-methyltransferase [Deltaproteobacteria bacterium]